MNKNKKTILGVFKKPIFSRIIAGSAFLLLNTCGLQKSIYETEREQEKRFFNQKSKKEKKKNFYQYDSADSLTTQEQKDEFIEQYQDGNIRRTILYIDEKLKNPSKEQIYIQSLIDTLKQSKVGEYLTSFAKENNVPVQVDSIDTSHYGCYRSSTKSIVHRLKGFYNDTLTPHQKEVKKAHHIMTLIEELAHANQDIKYNGLFENSKREDQLYPEARIFKRRNAESAAKATKIHVMHELKEAGYIQLWDNAKIAAKGSPIDYKLDFFDLLTDGETTDEKRQMITAGAYQNILKDEELKDRYSLEDFRIQYDTLKPFRLVSTYELSRATYLPGTKYNFIKNKTYITNKEYHTYSEKEYEIIKEHQDYISKIHRRFIPNNFTKESDTTYAFDHNKENWRMKFEKQENSFKNQKLEQFSPLHKKETIHLFSPALRQRKKAGFHPKR